MNASADFPSLLIQKIRQKGLTYEIRGLLASDDNVYPLGTDTKVISKVFELIIRPFVIEAAGEAGLIVFEAPQQNYYPDFTIMRDEADTEKIAVDVKSSYRNFRRSGEWTVGFTLGSYTSFLRTPTKNIAFPYHQYAKHYIIGFIYTRVDAADNQARSLSNRDSIVCPYRDVEWFIQEKHRISGTRAGSGNTANIGSITGTSVSDFASGVGPFSTAGEDVFLDYWRNYGRTSAERPFSTLEEYYQWKQKSAT